MGGTMRQGSRLGAALGVVACLLIGVPAFGGAATMSSPAPSSAAAGPAFQNLPREVLHEVERGQNLHLIAGYYYGDTRQWERIWQANRDVIRNPNRLSPGGVLRVPVERDWQQDLSYADWLKIGGPARAVAPAAAPAALPPGAASPAAGEPPMVAPSPPAPPAGPPPPARAPAGAAAKKGSGPATGGAKGPAGQ